MQLHGGWMGGGEEQLRFGVEFADGRKATNLGQRRPPDDTAPSISLHPHGGGGGGGRSWQFGYWVYPLPPAGPLTLGVAWPTRGLPEQIHALDAAPITDAASASIVLWDDDRPIGHGPGPSAGSSTMTRIHPT
jgi:hypothetical protein